MEARTDISMSFRVGRVVLLALVPLIGCGPRHPTKTIAGQITFTGGPPPKEGEVFFAPTQIPPHLPKRSGVGTFDVEGKFTLTSFDPGDGLVPGTYQVKVQCWRVEPTLATMEQANFVPPDFAPLVTIDPSAAEPVPVTIDVPAPRTR